MNELTSQMSGGLVAVFIVEWLKNSGWFTWLTPTSSKRIAVIFGALSACLTTVGVGVVFDYNVLNGGHVDVTLPSVHTLFDFARTWAFQEFTYRVQRKG